jgi:hypothetical protein
MTRWGVLAIAAVTNVIAVVALVAALWWGSGPGTAKTLALAGTVVIATASLVILFVAFGSGRLTAREPVGFPHDEGSFWEPPHHIDVEFRDRGDRFGPP